MIFTNGLTRVLTGVIPGLSGAHDKVCPQEGSGLVWSKKGRKRVGKRGRNEGGEMKRKEKERELGISMDIRTGLDCTVTKIS